MQTLRDTKYATWEWNYGQSRTASLVHRATLPCGTVEVQLEVDRGVITSVRFDGDFLGDWPVEEMEEQLTGVRFERSVLLESLELAYVDHYFDGTTPEDLLGLLLGA